MTDSKYPSADTKLEAAQLEYRLEEIKSMERACTWWALAQVVSFGVIWYVLACAGGSGFGAFGAAIVLRVTAIARIVLLTITLPATMYCEMSHRLTAARNIVIADMATCLLYAAYWFLPL